MALYLLLLSIGFCYGIFLHVYLRVSLCLPQLPFLVPTPISLICSLSPLNVTPLLYIQSNVYYVYKYISCISHILI